MIREEMLERMSMEEFIGWMAYSEIQPFGDEREDLRAGLLWSLTATINSDRKKHPKGIGMDKYPLFEMLQRLNKPPVSLTSKSLYGVLKTLSDATSKKPS